MNLFMSLFVVKTILFLSHQEAGAVALRFLPTLRPESTWLEPFINAVWIHRFPVIKCVIKC